MEKRHRLFASLLLIILLASTVPAHMNTTTTTSRSSDWSPSLRLTTTGTTATPASCTDPSGNRHLAWTDTRDGNPEIYYTKLASDGATIVPATRLTHNPADSTSPAIAADETYVNIAWEDFRNGNYEIYFTQLDLNGTITIDDTRITNALGASRHPSIQVATDHSIHLAWQDNRDGNNEIYYTRLTANAIPLTPETRLTNATGPSTYPSLDLITNTHAAATWQDKRDGNGEIYLDHIIINLIITNLTVTSSDATKPYLAVVGVPQTISLSIMNDGDYDVSQVPAQILLDGTNINTTITTIPAQATVTLTFTWTPAASGIHTLQASIDPTKTTPDATPQDNIRTVHVPVLSPGNIYDTLLITGTETYTTTILACQHLRIQQTGTMHMTGSQLLLYNTTPDITILGAADFTDSIITTSHSTEYINRFLVGQVATTFTLVGCTISNLANRGLELRRPSCTIQQTTIQNSQESALSCYNLPGLTITNMTIYSSALNDFNLTSTTLTVHNAHFNTDKINTDATSHFTYQKDVQLTVLDQDNLPAANAGVRVNTTNNQTLYTGTTDAQGQTPLLTLTVFEKTGTTQTSYTPLTFTTVHDAAFAHDILPDDVLFDAGIQGTTSNLDTYSRTKYALLIAGLDSIYQIGDRYRFWNDVEYTRHVLLLKGWKPENIHILFMNGTNYDYKIDSRIDAPANRTNVRAALQQIGAVIRNDATHRDTLFIYFGDHGAGEDDSNGYVVANSKLCMTDRVDLSDTEFAGWLATDIGHNASRTIILMTQCYNGGFIDNLHGYGRLIFSSTRPADYSWGYGRNDSYDSYKYDGQCFFPVEFLSALHNHLLGIGQYPDGSMDKFPTDFLETYPETSPWHGTITTDLDDDADHWISLYEAFDYALDHDLWGPVDGRAFNDWHNGSDSLEYPQLIDEDIIVIPGASGNISVDWYDGDGTFSGQTLHYGGNPIAVATATTHGTIYPDIILVDTKANHIGLITNTGQGFLPPVNYSVYSSPIAVATASLNPDGWTRQDIVSLGNYSTASILLSQPNGTYSRKDYYMSWSGSSPVAILATDLDGINPNVGDIVALSTDRKIAARWNNGTGSFQAITLLATLPSGTPTGMTCGDPDLDFDTDLIVTTKNPDRIYVYSNNGNRTFSLAHTITAQNGPSNPVYVDLGSRFYPSVSGVLFVANTTGKYGFCVYLYSLSSFNFSFKSTYASILQGIYYPAHGLYVTDLDGDDDLDVVLPLSNNILVYRNDDYNLEGGWTFTRLSEKVVSRANAIAALQPTAIAGTNNNWDWYPHLP